MHREATLYWAWDKIFVQNRELNLNPNSSLLRCIMVFNQEKLNWLETMYLHLNL